MNIKLTIDNREPQELKHYFKDNSRVVFENLIVGDYLFKDDCGIPKLIIERKNITDLQSSLKDGRFKEQRTRLLETGVKIIYLIEGQICNEKYVQGALENLALYHNICILPTANIKQTISTIESLLKKTCQDYKPVDSKSCKPRRKQDVDKSNLELMLETITGVSPVIAKVIAKDYKSVYDFCNCLDKDKKILHGLKLSEKRKLGPKMAEKITTSFFN